MYFWGNHINGIENFWGLCKVRLAKFRGLHKHKFYYHIKEGEFRYNNRNKSLYICLMKIIKKITTPLSCLEPNKLTTPGNFPSLETTKYLNTMKTTRKHLPFWFFLLVWVWKSSSLVQAQSDTTYTGDITVTTQVQVNALRNTLADKTRINGNLTIGSTFTRSNITDLMPLSNITDITGKLIIRNNGQLDSINDLNNLQTIGDSLWVSGNNQLTTLGNFSALQSIGGSFTVDNSELTTLGNFSNLQSIGGYFNVNNNDKLTTLGDFSVLQSIGGYFNVNNNDKLTTLGDFSNLQTIEKYFSVNNNDKLTTLGDFSNLQTIEKYFSVNSNDQLISLGSFPNLMSIGTGVLRYNRRNVSISIEENSNLVLCSWVERFIPTGTNAVTGDIYINNNATGCATTEEISNPPPVLLTENRIFSHKDSTTTSFNIYANVRWRLATSDDATWITSLSSDSSTHSSRITGENDATITLIHTRAPNEIPRRTILTLTPIDENGEELTNPAIITIHFTQLSTFYKGDITLRNQAEVNEFISNTTLILGNLTIGSAFTRSNITDLMPLSNIIDITGNLIIRNNGQLDSINDLNNLQTIVGYFSVYGNAELTTLGFSNLQSIGGYFNVNNNNSLTDLGDFSVLQSIGGFFEVGGNNELTDLGDFSALQTIGGHFNVNNNNSLTDLGDFSVLQSIGGYFRVSYNDKLTTLGNFSNLQTIEKYFSVNSNDQLISLGSFPNLMSIGTEVLRYNRRNVSISIEENSNLVLCSWVERFIPTGTNAVTGDIYINNNATGCATTEEISNPPPVLLTENRIFSHKDSTTTSFNIYANVRWQLVISDDATWITSLSSDSSTHSSRITGENDATITLIHTRAPNETPRSTTLTLTAIDEERNELTNPETMTIHFTQLSTFYKGDITLRNQAEVNEFISNTTLILGNLTIGSTFTRSNITDLMPLSNITDITGKLIIRNNGQLDSINDLNNLQTIGDSLSVSGNNQLTTLGDFTALQTIGGFNVRYNNELTTLGDFSNLQSIGGSFEVEYNRKLTNLGDFPVLTSIGIRSAYVPSLGRSTSNVSIVVEDNINLALCSWVEKFIPTGTNAVTGRIYINNNADGCNSTEVNPPVLIVTTFEDTTINHDATDVLTITFDLGGGAIGWESSVTGAGFITLDPSMDTTSTQETVTITATSGLNDGLERKDTIIFTTTGDIADTVVITQRAAPPTLVISTSDQTINHNAGDFTITFDLGGGAIGWESSVTGAGFITLDPSMNTTSTQETFIITATSGLNNGLERKDTIIFTTTGGIADTVVITQRALPTLVISTSDQTINHNAGDFTITFDLGGGATGWESSVTGAGFITLDPSMNTTSTQETFIITATSGLNDGLERKDTIIFTTTGDIADTVVITQRAAPSTLVISTSDQTINHSAGDFTITFDLGGGAIGWESSVTGAGFITLDPSMNTTSTQETVIITATSGLNNGLERKDTIIFTTTGGVADTVVITQEAAPPTLSLTSDSADTIAYNSTDDIDIMFNVGGGATGWTSKITYTPVDANFITRSQTGGTDITTAITIMATPTENTGIDERTATITLTTTGIGTPATQMVVIRQKAKRLIVTTNKNHQIAYNSTDPIPISFTVGGGAAGWTSEITYAPADANFITRSSSEGIDQTGAVTITATPTVNTGVGRTATITLTTTGIGTPATQMIVIRQGEANITISRETLIVTTNKNHQIAYNSTDPIPISFTVGGGAAGWTSEITYAPADANFITRSSSEGIDQTGAVTITATPTVNTGVERTATITLTTTGIGTPATQMIVIRQGEANITISRETLIITTNKNHQIAYDNIDPIPITFTIGGGATGWTSVITYTPANADFITLSSTEGTDITGVITLMATPTVNTGVERTATITLTTTGIGTPAIQMIVIRQGEANITISRETLIVTTNKNHQIAYDNIDPISVSFTIGGGATGWASEITYTPVDANFITRSSSEGTNQTGAVTITATPKVNTGIDERTATITLTTTGIGTPATQMIVIRQGEANTDTITMPPADTITLPPADTITMPPADTITLPPADTITMPPADTITMPPADTTTTLSTYTKEPFFTLYPNPTESTLTIKGVTGYLQMYIYDLVGREVMTYSLTPSKKTIDVSDLPSGMYVVTLQGEDKTWTEVLIIVN